MVAPRPNINRLAADSAQNRAQSPPRESEKRCGSTCLQRSLN